MSLSRKGCGTDKLADRSTGEHVDVILSCSISATRRSVDDHHTRGECAPAPAARCQVFRQYWQDAAENYHVGRILTTHSRIVLKKCKCLSSNCSRPCATSWGLFDNTPRPLRTGLSKQSAICLPALPREPQSPGRLSRNHSRGRPNQGRESGPGVLDLVEDNRVALITPPRKLTFRLASVTGPPDRCDHSRGRGTACPTSRRRFAYHTTPRVDCHSCSKSRTAGGSTF